MNAEETKQAVAVMVAFTEGKKIRFKDKDKSRSQQWHSIPASPMWNWEVFQYEVAPEPREWWVNVYPDGVRHIYDSQVAANTMASTDRAECIRVREVLE